VIRILDVLLAMLGLAIAAPLLLLLLLVGMFDTGAPLFRQERVGRHRQPFTLWKLRTMRRDAASVPTHCADPAAITAWGRLLRRSKLDELPQLWNVLRGDMSMVGPRPCLFSQQALIAARQARGIYEARPGITGLAQVHGIDMSTPERLAEADQQMLAALTPRRYFGYLLATVLGKGRGDRVKSGT
jgi:O-antigen biosynthesis protein WbqP